MVKIAHASIDENKKIKGGKAGDQTGREVCIRDWYNKPWNKVIRLNDRRMAERFAKAMRMAADNDLIGYDQNQRNTLLREARKHNYDISKIDVPCECDCSSLVCVALMYAGIPESVLVSNGNCATTRTLAQILKGTGKATIYSTPLYTASPDHLILGDILLKEGSHVAAVA